MDQRTLTDLQFERILEDAASRAQTEPGRRQVLSLAPLPDAGSCSQELALVEEAAAALGLPDMPGLAGVEDVSAHLDTARRGGVLAPAELMACARLFLAGHEVRTFFQATSLRAPTLCEWAAGWPDLGVVGERIATTFDADLRIRDEASPRLGELRSEAAALGQRVKGIIEGMLKDGRVRAFLQDEYYTLRDGRYVLPVRAEDRRFFPGIIHGTSQTGATVFVEPEPIIGDNNQLKWVLNQVEVEEYAILKERSALVGRYHDDARRLSEALFRLDSILARGRQALAFRGTFPRVSTGARESLRLDEARNPLLLTLGRDVVPVTVGLDEPPCALILSGPNAGGKTMALCTVGLCIAMARHGLLPPVGPGSTIPWYDHVFTVLGDLTSVDRAVSSFTGQIERVREVLGRPPGRALALLDELATGTEPRQGEALAAAVVETLVEGGVECLVATHFESLKELGREKPGWAEGAWVGVACPTYANARVGMDPQTGRPTYRVEMGEAGRSNPFETAEAAGLPAEVIARARACLDERERRLDEMLAEVEGLRKALAREKADAEALKARAALDQRRYEAELARLRRESDRLVHEARRDVLRKMKDLEEELDRIARQTREEEAAKRRVVTTRREVREKKAEVQAAMEREAPLVEDLPSDPVPEGDLRPGAEVFVVTLRATGRIVAVGSDRKRVVVQVGAMRTHVRVADLRRPAPSRPTPPSLRGPAHPSPPAPEKHTPPAGPVSRTSDNTVDLRGMRVDEALSVLGKRLDEAYRREAGTTLVVIHGMGTSALRKAVREYLESSPYGASYRPGTREEGGEGVTMVTLSES